MFLPQIGALFIEQGLAKGWFIARLIAILWFWLGLGLRLALAKVRAAGGLPAIGRRTILPRCIAICSTRVGDRRDALRQRHLHALREAGIIVAKRHLQASARQFQLHADRTELFVRQTDLRAGRLCSLARLHCLFSHTVERGLLIGASNSRVGRFRFQSDLLRWTALGRSNRLGCRHW